MPQEWELIEQRMLSGKGVLRVPSDAKKNRAYILYSDVIREPSNPFLNLNWNPPKARYGTLVFIRNDYVVDSKSIDFERQCYDGINDISGQTLIAVKCAYEGVLESILRLSTNLSFTPGGLGLAPVDYTNLIQDYENLRLAWDEIRVVAYGDTALQLRLFRLKYDTCDPEFDDDNSPPPPPPPDPKVPIGTPVPNSEPYDESTGDDSNSVPFPGDEPLPPPPLGEECQPYTLRFDFTYSQDGSPPIADSAVLSVYGPVSQEFRIKAGITGVLETQHRGNPALGGCGSYIYRDLTALGSNRPILSWGNISIE